MQYSKLSLPTKSRRGFVTLSATAGAAVAAAGAVSFTPAAPVAAAQQLPKPERGGGYHASEHVKRYYRSTLL